MPIDRVDLLPPTQAMLDERAKYDKLRTADTILVGCRFRLIDSSSRRLNRAHQDETRFLPPGDRSVLEVRFSP